MGLFYRACQVSAYALGRCLWGLKVEGRENVPRSGALLVTANHRSNLDPPVLGSALPREAGYAAKKELFAVPGLGLLIRALHAIPVDRGRLDRSTLRCFEERLGGGDALIVFPEGTRSRNGALGEAKAGVGLLLSRGSIPILPVWIEGTESPIRNVFRRGRVRIVFGRPYTLPERLLSSSNERERSKEIARFVLEAIGALRDEKASRSRETERPA